MLSRRVVQLKLRQTTQTTSRQPNLEQATLVEVEGKTGISISTIQDGLAHVHGLLTSIALHLLKKPHSIPYPDCLKGDPPKLKKGNQHKENQVAHAAQVL